jgi:hypothetical protein
MPGRVTSTPTPSRHPSTRSINASLGNPPSPAVRARCRAEARQAQEIVATSQVVLACVMLYDPRWPWHAAAELGAQVDAPPRYWRAAPREHAAVFRGARFGAR